MAVIFLQVTDLLPFVEGQETNMQGGHGEDDLNLTDAADHNFRSAAAASSLSFNERVGLDYAVYQIAVADTLTFVEAAQRGPAAHASDVLTFGDEARRVDADFARHTLTFVESAVCVPTKGVQNVLTFVQSAVVKVLRTITVAQTFNLVDSCGIINTRERCKQYRTLNGPNSAGGA
jgi:hypothetical protein